MPNRKRVSVVRLSATLAALALVVSACSGGSPSGSSGPSTPNPTPVVTPTSAPTGDVIAHPTGATEIVLRYDVGGGFVPMEFFAAHVPQFTMYGDGTVVFVSQVVDTSMKQAQGVGTNQPLRTLKLPESEVQALLLFALRDCGLAVAKTEYANQMVADAPTTTFTVNAEGDSKTVSAYALGFTNEPGPDTAILNALGRLAERLGNFDQNGAITSEPYVAKAFRATLTWQQGGVQGVQISAWPWEDLTVADFTFPADPNQLPQGIHLITADQVAALNIAGAENGLNSGFWTQAGDGRTFSLSIRPLLPEEKE